MATAQTLNSADNSAALPTHTVPAGTHAQDVRNQLGELSKRIIAHLLGQEHCEDPAEHKQATSSRRMELNATLVFFRNGGVEGNGARLV